MSPDEGSYGARFLVNCSMRADHSKYDLKQDLELIHSNVSLVRSRIAGADDLAPIIGVMIAIMMYAVLNLEVFNAILYKVIKHKIIPRTTVLVILLFLSPIIITLILLALIYKLLCYIIIRKYDENFEAFLDAFDVFWSLDDDGIKNIIHVLGVVEADSSEILVDKIKEKLSSAVSSESCSKIFYRRNKRFGWYYWRKYKEININEYVDILNVGNTHDILKDDLENMMTDVCSKPLPFNNEGLFQILVTKQKIKNSKLDAVNDYGLIFRIDHAVGDGVALIEFLCHALADKVDNEPDNLFSMPTSYNTEKHRPTTSLLDMVKKLCSAPICFVDGILRKPDESSLHGPTLLGKKTFKWTDPQDDLFQMIKDIKQYNGEINFSDILATSLSSGLRNYYAKTMDHIPEDVAVILPIRLPKAKNDFKLENNITVTILDLPTNPKGAIKKIKRRHKMIRKSIDPMVHHYFLKVCNIFPEQILRPLFESSPATLIFSNMPGPDSNISICGGSSIKSLVFFIPNKGNTAFMVTGRTEVFDVLMSLFKAEDRPDQQGFETSGLGVSALYYGGVLRFSAMADTNLIPDSEHLSIILDSMVEEIRRLHSIYVQP